MPFSDEFLSFLRKRYGEPKEMSSSLGGGTYVKFDSGIKVPLHRLEKEHYESKKERTITGVSMTDRVLRKSVAQGFCPELAGSANCRCTLIDQEAIHSPSRVMKDSVSETIRQIFNMDKGDSAPKTAEEALREEHERIGFVPFIPPPSSVLEDDSPWSKSVPLFRSPFSAEDVIETHEKLWLPSLGETDSKNQDNKKGRKTMNEIRTKKIVDRFYNNAESAVRDDRELKIEAMLREDSNVQQFAEKDKELRDLLRLFAERDHADVTGYDHEPDTCDLKDIATPGTRAKLNELNKSADEAIAKCRKEKGEVLDVLSACDTYDQEYRVLVAYGILTEEGKLRSYKLA